MNVEYACKHIFESVFEVFFEVQDVYHCIEREQTELSSYKPVAKYFHFAYILVFKSISFKIFLIVSEVCLNFINEAKRIVFMENYIHFVRNGSFDQNDKDWTSNTPLKLTFTLWKLQKFKLIVWRTNFVK